MPTSFLLFNAAHNVVVSEVWKTLWLQRQISQLFNEFKRAPDRNAWVMNRALDEAGRILLVRQVLIRTVAADQMVDLLVSDWISQLQVVSL